MRVEVQGEGLLERFAVATRVVPTPMVLAFLGEGAARTLTAGLRLGLFELLEKAPRSAVELAADAHFDPEALTALLDALNGFGWLRREGGRFTNTRVTRRWLLAGARFSMHDGLLFVGDLWDLMPSIEERVRTGQRSNIHHGGMKPETWERYMRGLAGFGLLAGPWVAGRVKLDRPPQRLLDVGGGHGMYSVGFCKRFTGLQAEVLDLAPAAEHGRKLVAEQGMAERVRYREGDLRTTDWGGPYDVVLLFNVLHNLPSAQGLDAVKRAHAALRPGGTLVVFDGEHVERSGQLGQTGGFGELFFFLISGAGSHTEEAMSGWIREAGFDAPAVRRLPAVPMVMLSAQRPSRD